jgi:putative oxidoreductase
MKDDTLLPSPRSIDWALLLIRLAAGLPFLYHGSGILFDWNGPGIAGFAASTHMPAAVALLVGLAEFLGGLAMVTGVLTRLGGICTAIVMIGAIALVHWPHGYDVTKGGMEYALAQLLNSAVLVITGAGDYSLVRVLPQYRNPGGIALPQT